MLSSSTAHPRVLVVAPGEIFGGAERQILTLVETLQNSVCFNVILFFDGVLAARLKEMGIETLVPPSFVSALQHIDRLGRNADVIHVHGYKASVAACISTKLRGAKILKTVHGAPELKQRTLLASLTSRAYYALELTLDFLSRPEQVFVTRDLQSRWPPFAVCRRATVIYNGVDTKLDLAQKNARSTERGKPKRALIVGRLDFVKGIDVAIEAMSLLPKGLVHLFILGDGPEKIALSEACSRLGVEDRVTFLGFVENPSNEMATADVLLMPSRHEGLPYTLLEAMRAKTPIVASRVGGIAEVLEHGNDAILEPPNNAQSLAHAISAILDNPTQAMKLAEHAHRKLLSAFSDRKSVV